ncbi:MAG: OmpA family protein [Erythrobacter sp.]
MAARLLTRRRTLLMAAGVIILAGCQTVPRAPFSAAQREVLAKLGFHERDGNYLLGLESRLLFGFDSAVIEPAKQGMLHELGRALAEVGIGSAAVEGHASAEGDAQYNLALSGRRAEAVRDALTVGGLVPERMRVRAMGALDPIASNDTEEGRRENRRVVIIVTPSDALGL